MRHFAEVTWPHRVQSTFDWHKRLACSRYLYRHSLNLLRVFTCHKLRSCTTLKYKYNIFLVYIASPSIVEWISFYLAWGECMLLIDPVNTLAQLLVDSVYNDVLVERLLSICSF